MTVIAGAGRVVWAPSGRQFCGSTEASRVGKVVVGRVEGAGVLRELVGLEPFAGEGVLEE